MYRDEVVARTYRAAMRVSEALAPGRLPQGERVYAVGDVHGCANRLRALHGLIAADMVARPVATPFLVHLGDYVDRGEDSRGAVQALLAAPPGLTAVHLMGNHEQMMLAALSPAAPDSVRRLWLENGGTETLLSYGLPPHAPARWADLEADHAALLAELPDRFARGGYLFVHAGIRPGIAIEAQTTQDLLWIREPFLAWHGPLPAVVVHGHTPVATPEVLPQRIAIDTGAVFGGDLTCAVLEADRISFLVA
jgi:serine/threonine protein phosphatase 1